MAPTVARLVALTNEAVHALGGRHELPIAAFPVRFGRERRSAQQPVAENVRREGSPPLNHVYLNEISDSSSHHISGAHFEITQVEGRIFLVDRGSACGTLVAGARVGGRRAGGTAELHDGDEIVVGTIRSPYVFRFTLAAAEDG